MTVQKNKYFIGSYVFAVLDDVKNQQIYYMKINGIYRQDDNIIYQDEIGVEAKEENIFPDKNSAEAELNKIKVGDVVYYVYKHDCGYFNANFLSKSTVTSINYSTDVLTLNNNLTLHESYAFKTEEELIASLRSY